MEIGESHTLARNLVNVGCVNLAPIAPQVAEAEVVLSIQERSESFNLNQ
jgi:hypothetical protein